MAEVFTDGFDAVEDGRSLLAVLKADPARSGSRASPLKSTSSALCARLVYPGTCSPESIKASCSGIGNDRGLRVAVTTMLRNQTLILRCLDGR